MRQRTTGIDVRRLTKAVAFAAMAMALAGCGSKPSDPGKGAGKAGASEDAAAVMVNVRPAARGDIARTIDVTGSLVALNDVTVGAKSSGKVVAVYPREGEQVAAGQIVAQMDTIDIRAQLGAQEAGARAAVTRLDQAKAQLQQAKTSLLNSETQLTWTQKTTDSAVKTAEAALQTAQDRLSVVQKGAREQERRQAEENVRAAKANNDKARADLKRMQALFREQAVSQSQLDQAEATSDAADAQYRSATEALSLIKEGARPEDINTAKLAVLQAQQGLDRANADRAQIAIKQADVQNSKENVRVAESGVRAAEAAVKQANEAVKIARQALIDASIRAPISGYVASRTAEPGQQVAGGGMGSGSILRIVAPKSVYFQASVSETQVAEVGVGQSVQVTVDALPGRTFNGSVTRILPVASSAARSFTLRVDFPTDAALRPQMFARGRILLDTHRGTVLVSKDAVIFDPARGKSRAFVMLATKKAQEREVKVGYTDPTQIEILAGIKPGESVVVQGQSNLQDGDTVRVE